MLRSNRILSCFLAAVALASGGSAARAATLNGTQAISEIDQVTANGSPTGNINTATTFTFGDLLTSRRGNTNDFTTYGAGGRDLGGATLVLTPTSGGAGTASFTFTSPATAGRDQFGTFSASTFQTLASDSLTQSYYLLGSFTPGSIFPGGPNGFTSGPASLVIIFSQNADGSIGASLTLASPPQALQSVPEPASLAMLGLGLAGVVGVRRLRRKAA